MKRDNYPRTIYAIKHNVTGKVYIGSSVNISERYYAHICLLRKGKHSANLMQKDFDKYGEDYTVYKIGTIKDESEKDLEYQKMLEYDTINPEHGYNQGDFKMRSRRRNISMTISENNNELIRYGEIK